MISMHIFTINTIFYTYPVPRPAMMIGCLLSGGSFMTEGLIDTVTLSPGLRAAKYLVH